MQKPRIKPLVAALAVIVVLVAVYVFDPMSGDFPFPRCIFKSLTGWSCPGCGATRALHALLHCNFAEAWGANPAVFMAVPLAAAAIVADSHAPARLRGLIFSPASVAVLIAVTIIWTLLRNILCL